MTIYSLQFCSDNKYARFELSAGSYVIVPATFQAGDTSSFMMRVYCENMVELLPL